MTDVSNVRGGKPPRVLLADDQPAYLAEMAELLRGAGYDCDCVADGQQVEAELSRNAVDVLVADIRMPGNFNLELVEQVRSSQCPPQVILMTGFPTLQTAIHSIRLKISAYLVKPFSFNELLTEVRNALDARHDPTVKTNYPPRTPVPESGSVARRSCEDLAIEHPEVDKLTKREHEVLVRVLMGDDVPSIGGSLFISPHTVRNHLKAIYRKLDVRSRVELVVRFGPLTRVPVSRVAEA